ncbi:phosphoribosylglycinamide synthetase C domain-containing protein, partial [Salinimicrobium oceani]
GDPETEVVLPRIETDLVEVFQKTASGKLNEVELQVKKESAATLVLVSGGYPEDYEKGKEITGLEKVEDSIVFHAGTKEEHGKTLTNGGRVLAITSFGSDFKEAIKKSYQNAEKLHFDKMYFRKDIGFDL